MPEPIADRVNKAIALYVLTDNVGRAIDLLDAAARVGALGAVDPAAARRASERVFTFAEIEGLGRDLVRALDPARLGRGLARLALRR